MAYSYYYYYMTKASQQFFNNLRARRGRPYYHERQVAQETQLSTTSYEQLIGNWTKDTIAPNWGSNALLLDKPVKLVN